MPKTRKLKKTKKGKKRSRTNKTQMGGNSNIQFMDAIMDDNLPYIEDNIVKFTDLSFENSRGETPLDIAIDKYNDLKTTNFMGDYGRKLELTSIRTQIIETLLKNGANGENIEIPGIDFSKTNLRNVKLKGANLSGANLEKTNLSNANLEGANLSNTNLTKTIFNGAKLDGTDFTGTLLDTQTPENSVLDESQISVIEADPNDEGTIGEFSIDDSFDMPIVPQTPSGLMDSVDHDDEHELWNRMETVHRETEQERSARLKRERTEKKQKYLLRPETTLTMNNTNPFEKVGLSGYHVFEMEDVNFCDYIRENIDNVIFIYDQQVGVFDKPTIRNLITTETLDETKIVYECNEISEAFVPHEENIISGPMLNMRILAINGLMIPLNELDAAINGEHQIFVIETGNDKPTIPIASLPTRLAMGDNESGQAVVSANHCQAEVSIKVGNLSYIENQVLLDQCTILGRGKTQKTRRKKKKTKRVRQKKSKRSRKNKKKDKKSLNK